MLRAFQRAFQDRMIGRRSDRVVVDGDVVPVRVGVAAGRVGGCRAGRGVAAGAAEMARRKEERKQVCITLLEMDVLLIKHLHFQRIAQMKEQKRTNNK